MSGEVTMNSQGPEVITFIEEFLTLGGSFYGEPFNLFPFQKDIVNQIYELDEEGRRKHRTFLLGLSRKQAKTTLAAALGVFHLIADQADRAPVAIAAAGDRQQARLVFDEVRRMISMSPDLREVCDVFRSEIRCNINGGIFRAVSADAALQEGLNPSWVCVDEYHRFKNKDLFDVLTLGSATRNQPLTLVISTAGHDLESPLGELYQYGRKVESGEIDDPTFGFKWHGLGDNENNIDVGDPDVWARCNPAWDCFMNKEEMESAFKRTHEAAFTRYRLNGWTRAETAWLQNGVFEGLASTRRLEPGERIVLGLDGAWQNDATALVACSVDEPRHLEVIGLWEKPEGQSAMSWRTPIPDVKAVIIEAFERYSVVELAADPWRLESLLFELSDSGYPVTEFSTNALARMTQATQLAYDAIIGGDITHDGSPELIRHFSNAVLREDPRRGSRITKDRKGSSRKVDLVIASIIALHRASFWKDETPAQPELLII